METHAIAANVLGPAAEQGIGDEVGRLAATLDRLDPDDWQRPTPCGDAPVATIVAHLTEGAQRLGAAWERQVDAEANQVLLHTFDDPATSPEVTMDTSDPAAVFSAYRAGTGRLRRALGTVRQQDWSWPVWSPLGGVETLAEAVRRWLAHHHVHRADVLAALHRPIDADEDAVRLVAEFVLDALARRGGDTVPAPMTFEVVTSLPGAGTWSLVFEEEAPRPDITSVWKAIVDRYPQPTQLHRIERGSSGTARLQLRAPGEALWRAAFQRDGSWDDIEVHGDDQAREVWATMLDHVAGAPGQGLGQVQS